MDGTEIVLPLSPRRTHISLTVPEIEACVAQGTKRAWTSISSFLTDMTPSELNTIAYRHSLGKVFVEEDEEDDETLVQDGAAEAVSTEQMISTFEEGKLFKQDTMDTPTGRRPIRHVIKEIWSAPKKVGQKKYRLIIPHKISNIKYGMKIGTQRAVYIDL